MIELFCGSGRTTAAIRYLGFRDSFGVDHKKLSSCAPVLQIDMESAEGQRLILQYLSDNACLGVFLAPPCGTASRARSIRLLDHKGKPIRCPKPVRSDFHPNGIPGLVGTDFIRVSKSNVLYAFTSRVIRFAHERGLVVCVENPKNSLFWKTTFIQSLRDLPFKFADHQACAYGSQRPKWTRLQFNHDAFLVICRVCPGECATHKHLPWGLSTTPGRKGFATSEETAYPFGLAAEIAQCFRQAAYDKGIKPPPVSVHQASCDDFLLSMARASSGSQVKANKLPPLVPEHETCVTLHAKTPPCDVMKRIKSPFSGHDQSDVVCEVPPESQLLAHKPFLPPSTTGGGEGWKETQDCLLTFGIPWSPMDFVKKAVEAGHPSLFLDPLPPALQDAVSFVAGNEAHVVSEFRTVFFKKWLSIANSISKEEFEVKSSMPSHAAEILRPKRLKLWGQILDSVGYPDPGVIEHIISGTSLTGETPRTGVFPSCFRPATISSLELDRMAGTICDSVLGTVRSSGDNALDVEVLDITMEERKKNWLRGPLQRSELPKDAVISRRFGIRQGPKTRAIDDLSQSLINATVQSCESPKPHTADFIAAMCRGAMLCCDSRTPWEGRSFDLKSAYRQLALAEASLSKAYIAVFNPSTKRPDIFQMVALPFGAVQSVHSFLRCSHAPWFTGVAAVKLAWSAYFDDFICIAPSDQAKATEASVELLFRLLGWTFASSGDKAGEFSASFKALGIDLDVSRLHQGVVLLSNTEKRVAELVDEFSRILKSGRLGRNDAMRLRGRLQFSSGQIFGRSFKRVCKLVSKFAGESANPELDDDSRLALKSHIETLTSSRPREVLVGDRQVFFIFTDAAFDHEGTESRGSIGGVLVDSTGVLMEYFSHQLSSEVLEALGDSQKKTVIYECELLAFAGALKIWSEFIKDCDVVGYVDNNPARDSVISGGTSSLHASPIVYDILATEEALRLRLWIARVPSPSNIADAPSRLQCQELESLGVHSRVSETDELFLRMLSKQWS